MAPVSKSDPSPADSTPSSSTGVTPTPDSSSLASPLQPPLPLIANSAVADKESVDTVVANQLEQIQTQADISLRKNRGLQQYSDDPVFTSL